MKPSKALREIVGDNNAKRLPTLLADIARLSIDDMRKRGVSLADARKISAAISLAKEIAEPSQDYVCESQAPRRRFDTACLSSEPWRVTGCRKSSAL